MVVENFFKVLENLEFGELVVTTPDGKLRHFAGDQPGAKATLNIRDNRAVTAFATKGDIGVAEAYRDGWWDTDDLPQFILLALQNDRAVKEYIYGTAFSRFISRILYFFKRNTLRGSRKNIHAHYDLGNAFYSLWLDPTMTYSAAIFDDSSTSLISAQHHKYDRILNLLNSDSGNILEIGCGWGGFAERAMQQGDYRLKGLTLSTEQQSYAQDRLGRNVDIALQDYRHENQKFDHIVSIEMFEAVGEKYWPIYFEKLKHCLKEKGNAVIQTITINEDQFEEYRKGGDFIRSYIFPGGMLPSKSVFQKVANDAGLRVNDQFSFGHGYAKTLQHWLDEFDAKAQEVLALGFDQPFIRMWRFYLAACIASFTIGRTDVMQVELAHAA
jgi:cyclopropane-fatty-acyl-phospholipid synthase